MSCSPTNPQVGNTVKFGKPLNEIEGTFTVVNATITAVHAGLVVDLSYGSGSSVSNIAHSSCAAFKRWGCGTESCADPDMAWGRLSDARIKRPV